MKGSVDMAIVVHLDRVMVDKKYGSTKNPLRHMCLHHEELILLLPGNIEHRFYAKVPKYYDIFK